jgi:L-aminopeptidase/D-esterase-like protein
VPLAGTATGSAFEDRTTSHVAKDAVETGVTAIACAIDLPGDDAAVSITAPSWRIEEFGLMRAQRMVEAVSREIAQRLKS